MCRRKNRYQRYFVSSCLEKKILYSRGGGSTVYILSAKLSKQLDSRVNVIFPDTYVTSGGILVTILYYWAMSCMLLSYICGRP